MTNNYKENILKYLIGTLPQQTGVNSPTFSNVEQTTNNLRTEIYSHFDGTVFYVDFIPSKNNRNQNLNYSVLAVRGTKPGEVDESGAYIILDENYNIVEFIDTYKDGTPVSIISCLNVDDKGNFYGIEQRGSNFYIIELNNLVLKLENQTHFEAVLKKSIKVPTTYSWEDMYKIFRDNSGDKYFIIGERNLNDEQKMVGIHAVISDSPRWTYYASTYDIAFRLTRMFNNGFEVYWDSNGDVQFKIAINRDGLVMLSKGSSNNMVSKRITNDNTFNNPYCNFLFYSNTLGYYAIIEDDTDNNTSEFKLYKIDLTNNAVSVIYTKQCTYNGTNQMWLFKNNNAIYFTQAGNNGVNFDLAFGLIDGNNVYEETLGTFTANYFLTAFCYSNIINHFNKNYVYIQNQNTLFTLECTWNDSNYNGTAFTSNASLIPAKATILDNNNSEIFNRNLYNLSNYSNRYIATLQIPNYFLNNETLKTANLYSKNNNLMCTDTINTTKNIYEELYINFINQFDIVDKDNNIQNISAASSLVSSMFNYSNDAYISKFRINYNDQTTSIKTLSNNGITNYKTTLYLGIYVNKKIDSINILSQNENINYLTIDCSSLETGKYYLITEDLRIE